MRSRFIVITLCGLVAASGSSAAAQRGGMGGMGGRGGSGGRGGNAFPTKGGDASTLDEDELSKVDPARALLDKAKALKLTGPEKDSLDTIAKRYDWNTHQFAKRVDSLSAAAHKAALAQKPTGSATFDSTEFDAMAATRRALTDALQSIRDEFKTDSSSSMEKLDDDQRKAAVSIVADARSKLDDMLTRAGSSGGGRRGRGGPPIT